MLGHGCFEQTMDHPSRNKSTLWVDCMGGGREQACATPPEPHLPTNGDVGCQQACQYCGQGLAQLVDHDMGRHGAWGDDDVARGQSCRGESGRQATARR